MSERLMIPRRETFRQRTYRWGLRIVFGVYVPVAFAWMLYSTLNADRRETYPPAPISTEYSSDRAALTAARLARGPATGGLAVPSEHPAAGNSGVVNNSEAVNSSAPVAVVDSGHRAEHGAIGASDQAVANQPQTDRVVFKSEDLKAADGTPLKLNIVRSVTYDQVTTAAVRGTADADGGVVLQTEDEAASKQPDPNANMDKAAAKSQVIKELPWRKPQPPPAVGGSGSKSQPQESNAKRPNSKNWRSFPRPVFAEHTPQQLRKSLERTAVEVDLYRRGAQAAKSFDTITREVKKAAEDRVRELQHQRMSAAKGIPGSNKRKEKLELRAANAMVSSEITVPSAAVAEQYFDAAVDFEPLREWLPMRPDLNGLPFRNDEEARLDFPAADRLRYHSTRVRLVESSSADAKEEMLQAYLKSERLAGADVPALTQMLQVREPATRFEYVNTLAKIDDPQATDALISRAIFDLSEPVRREATFALGSRDFDRVRPRLLAALEHPWDPAVQHAGEALAKLGDQDLIPVLEEKLDQPDPRGPVQTIDDKWECPQLVKINHLRNCYLCHAPSLARVDTVRGLVPSPTRRLPRTYYQSSAGDFVRADVTYLKQDFSVMHELPPRKVGPWPTQQRFDYVVGKRQLSDAEAREELAERAALRQNTFHDAVLHALHGIEARHQLLARRE